MAFKADPDSFLDPAVTYSSWVVYFPFPESRFQDSFLPWLSQLAWWLTAPRVCRGSGVVRWPMAAIVSHYPRPPIGRRVGRAWPGLFTLLPGRGRDRNRATWPVAA